MVTVSDTKGVSDLVKGVGDLIKSAGATDQHREAFGRTFLGTLLGQTLVFMGMLGAYIVAIVLLWKYAMEDLKALHSAVGTVWFGLTAARLRGHLRRGRSCRWSVQANPC